MFAKRMPVDGGFVWLTLFLVASRQFCFSKLANGDAGPIEQVMKDRIVAAWQAKNAQKLLSQAKVDGAKRRTRFSLRLIIAYFFAAIFLYSAYAVLALGLYIIVWSFGQILPVIFGAIILFVGYLLLPKRGKNTEKTFRRNDFPVLFGLMDEIAKAANTTSPDGLHLDSDPNAYIAHFRPWMKPSEWVVGIGFTIWEALDDQEKIAVLAHEMSHKVNDDPNRNSILGDAQKVIGAQLNILNAPRLVRNSGFMEAITDLVIWLLSKSLVAIYKFILRAIYFESQRAEYRADALGTLISGKRAYTGVLEKLTRGHLAQRAVLDLFPYTKNQDGTVFDHMGKAIASADQKTCQDLLDRAAKELQRTDLSHPPTHMRLEFVQSLSEDYEAGLVRSESFDFPAIQNELKDVKNALGKAFMQQMHAQEVNR